tara:strand:+ start:240 stop:1073 length:834 start_codon:yes stop_codon:yes gene_type:complete
MKNKISKKIGGTMGPKRKSAPKPIVSNKVIARRVSKNPSVKSYNVSKKQTTSLPTSGGERKKNELSYVQHETGRAKRTMSPSVTPSKFEQKKIKAMNKYQSKVAKKDYSAKRKQERQAKRAQSMRQRQVIKNIRKTGRPEAPLQNGQELKPIMIKPNMGRIVKPMAKFPDLSGDGKVTKKDILMGRGVIDKPKMKKNNKSKTEANVMKGVTISATDPMKDALLEASRHGKNALKLMRQGDVEGAKAANELKIAAARQAKDIEFARLKGGTIDRLTLR